LGFNVSFIAAAMAAAAAVLLKLTQHLRALSTHRPIANPPTTAAAADAAAAAAAAAAGEAVYTIFVLQTQRRLESDRFYTDDFDTPAYTAAGLAYVNDTTMADILR
jgi:hypothetical protein